MCPTPPPAAMEEEAAAAARALIQRVRRRYNQEAAPGRTAEDEEAIRELVTTVAAEAKLLSTELYTQATHFVLELLQNADDASYAPGVQPRVLLVVMPDAILHATNETGFTAANVEAICAMGRSTKSRKVGAFTGEKGIGFKATAVASELTYIASNSYTFAFDMRPDAYDVPCLGLVCPRWEEDLTQRMQEWLAERVAGTGVVGADLLQGFGTLMWMQLKPDLDKQKLMEELQLLDPYMLLNLRQLKAVTVMMLQPDSSGDGSKQQCHVKHMTRVDVGASHIALGREEGLFGTSSVATSTRHLLCMRQVLQVPAAISDAEEKRQGVEEVEVVFALPQSADGSAEPDPDAQVFAFLPCRPYGFRFHIQADFVLPSSREGILEGRGWNQWLRNELAPTFIKLAMAAVHAHQATTATNSSSTSNSHSSSSNADSPAPQLSPADLLQYLPLPSDVSDGFMRSVSDRILQELRETPCVLTASGRLSTASGTLLPEPLLLQADGRPLISNTWLQQGLPGLEYVHDSCFGGGGGADADAAAGARTTQVLVQLGSKRFSRSLLLQWLASPGARQLLQGLSPDERTAWLQQLYSRLHSLQAQPHNSPMHLPTGNTSVQQSLRAAPIVQLYGSKQLVSVDELRDSNPQLFLWNFDLGRRNDLRLFSRGGAAAAAPGSGDSSSSGLCFVDPGSLGPDGATILRATLGVQVVPLQRLVATALQLQADGQLTDAQHDQLVLFLLRNAGSLGAADLRLLQDGLMLCQDEGAHISGGSDDGDDGSGQEGGARRKYTPAKQLYLPLASTQLADVPGEVLQDPSLQQDLSAAGAAFISPHYEALAAEVLEGGQRTVWQLLNSFGARWLTQLAAVKHLLKLYDSDSSDGIRLSPDHERHLAFLSHCMRGQGCLQHIREGLWLYDSQQDPAQEAPENWPADLAWPLSGAPGADAINAQLQTLCNVCFVHPCYVRQGAPGHTLVKAITEPLSPKEVWELLVELHSSPAELAKAMVGTEAGPQGLNMHELFRLQDLLLQQLTYLAGVRLQLQTASKQRGLLLLSSTGQLMPTHELHIPPTDAAALALLWGLEEAGHGLPLLHPCFAACWQDTNSEQCLLLTQVLGVRQADTASVISALAGLHSSSSASMPEPERAKHLTYLAQHTQLLQQQKHSGLLQQVQQSVLLLDAAGQHRRASTLHMPLGPHFASLQSDMCAAGMAFLHSSYTTDAVAGSNTSTSATVQRKTALRQLGELLTVMGVQESDAAAIVRHILKLYANKQQQPPSVKQHLSHLRFIRERWLGDIAADVQRCVTKDLPLLVASCTGGNDNGGSSSDDDDGSGSDDSSSSSSSSTAPTYAPASTLYLLPASDSEEAGLMKALLPGGASFLNPVYAEQGPEQGLEQWLQSRMGVRAMSRQDAVRHLLSAHVNAQGQLQQVCSANDLARHALYVALHADADVLRRCRQQLLLVVELHSEGPRNLLCRTASNGPQLYFPAKGRDWTLQEVLPADRVMYVHRAYSKLLSSLQQGSYEASRFRSFLGGGDSGLQLAMRPVPGSVALRKAAAAGECWQALLLLMRDEWGCYSDKEKRMLAEVLKVLQVNTTAGSKRRLRDCFLPQGDRARDLLPLLQETQMPVLDVPEPNSPRWEFLQQLGVGMSLQWPTLLKILQQLSSSGATPDLSAMQQLYSSISALVQLSADTRGQVRAAFNEQPLVYLPPSSSSKGGGKGRWLSSWQVWWKPEVGRKRLFPHGVFIQNCYQGRDAVLQGCEQLFTGVLDVQDATVNDLKDSLLYFAKQPPEGVADVVQQIYELLAKQAAHLTWLPELLTNSNVLLVRRGDLLSWGCGISGPTIYLPDSSELLQLFADDCCTLAVEAAKLPALQPLLSVICPPLTSLSASVQRSFAGTAAAVVDAGDSSDGSMQRQLEPFWTDVLQQAVPLFTRFLYYKHQKVFEVLFAGGHFTQLAAMPVVKVAGLVQTLTLGSVSKQVPAQAAVDMLAGQELAELQQLLQEQGHNAGLLHAAGSSSAQQPVLLVDAAAAAAGVAARSKLVFCLADALADLLLQLASTSNTVCDAAGATQQQLFTNAVPSMAGKLRSMLKDLAKGDVEDVEAELAHDRVGQLPPEFNPWRLSLTGAAAARDGSGPHSEGSSSDVGSDEESKGGGDEHTGPAQTAAQAIDSAGDAGLDSLVQEVDRLQLSTAAEQAHAAQQQQQLQPLAGQQQQQQPPLTGQQQQPHQHHQQQGAPDGEHASVGSPTVSSGSPGQRRILHARRRSRPSAAAAGRAAAAAAGGGSGADAAGVGSGAGAAATEQPGAEQGGASALQQALEICERAGLTVYRTHSSAAAPPPDALQDADLVEAVPAGAEHRWIEAAVSAAHAAAGQGQDLQRLRNRLQMQQLQDSGTAGLLSARLARLPQQVIVDLPEMQPGAGAGASGSCSTAAAAAAANGPPPSSTAELFQEALANGAAAAATAAAATHEQPVPPSSNGVAGSSAEPVPPVYGGATGFATAAPAARAQLEAMHEAAIKVVGDVGERYVYEYFSQELPGFDGSCWASGSRSMIGLPAPAAEPPYDFIYTDVDGRLSGEPGKRCFIEVKATRATISSGNSTSVVDPRPFEVSHNQWELARALHAHPEQGTFMFVRVEGVGSPGGPRIASVLQDPVQLLAQGQLWVTSREKLLVESYPVVPRQQ